MELWPEYVHMLTALFIVSPFSHTCAIFRPFWMDTMVATGA